MTKQIKTIIIASLIITLFAGAAAAAEDGKATIKLITIEDSQPKAGETTLTFPQVKFIKAAPKIQASSKPTFNLAPKSNLGDSLFTTSLITLTALNLADFYSTSKALKIPGLAEGNPLMKSFVKNDLLFAGVKIGIAALDYILLKNVYKKNKTAGWVLSIVVNFAMSYVVANNFKLISQAQGRI